MEIQLIQKKYSKIAEKPGEYFKGMIVLRRKSSTILYLHMISRRTIAEIYVVIEIYLSYINTHINIKYILIYFTFSALNL